MSVPRPEAQRLDELEAEARYHRQRFVLYRARLYAGRALSVSRLEEFQHTAAHAAERLERARARARQADRLNDQPAG